MKFTEHNDKVLEQFASMIIERMEQMKAGDWQKGWVGATLGGSPVNIEGRSYGGNNVFLLMLHSAMNGFKFPVYCTMRQANRLGARIKKGSRSTPVIFWDYSITSPDGRKLKNEQYRRLSETERSACTVIPFLKSYNVFNVEQTDIDEKCPDILRELQGRFAIVEMTDDSGMYDNKGLDTMLDRQTWLCPVEYRKPSDGAFYSVTYDKVVVPMKSQFKRGRSKADKYRSGQEFYSTLLHELIHSTGIESRLNRNTGKRFGDKLYAREELVAELGAARIGQQLGFDKRILDNNAAYLDGWISSLKEEPRYVLSLMTDVDKASRMVLDRIVS